MALILIADDDQQIRKFIRRVLEKAGYDTLVAANGKEAIRNYKEKHPDLVLTDIVMPEKEGIEVIMELKEITPDVKIIAISGGGTVRPQSYLTVAKTLGAQATIEKPIDVNDLLSTIEAVLSGA